MGKMNKLFLTTILILFLPIVTALYAGNQENITLSVSPSSCVVIDNESNPLSNYNTDGLNFTINGTKVIINTNPALMPGNYTLICDYPQTEETSTSSGGSSSGGYSSSWICGNWSDCIDSKSIRDCWKGTNKNINYTQSKSCVSETKEQKEKEEVKVTEKETEDETEIIENITAVIVQNETKVVLPTKEDEGWIYLGIIIITIAFIIFGFYVIKNKRDSNSDSERNKKDETL